MKPKICVVGSANIDQVSYVKRTPNDGETVFGDSYQMGFGGKGANQAVMAGILGAEVYVITCLGSDVYRDMTIENFKNNDVITDYIQTVDVSSGVAPIWVDESGQNRNLNFKLGKWRISNRKTKDSTRKLQNLSFKFVRNQRFCD